MEHYTCEDCGDKFGNPNTRNKRICPRCMGRKGGAAKRTTAWPNVVLPKEAREHPSGYLYYTQSMCTPEEVNLLPGSGRCILLHRLIMAQHLGRPLRQDEVVMHIDGNKRNNSIENLQVGDSQENTSQHWQARQDAAFWRNAAVTIFLALGAKP